MNNKPFILFALGKGVTEQHAQCSSTSMEFLIPGHKAMCKTKARDFIITIGPSSNETRPVHLPGQKLCLYGALFPLH